MSMATQSYIFSNFIELKYIKICHNIIKIYNHKEQNLFKYYKYLKFVQTNFFY